VCESSRNPVNLPGGRREDTDKVSKHLSRAPHGLSFRWYKEPLMSISTAIRLVYAAIAITVAALASPPATAASAVREPNGAIRYYDDNGFDRGYAWCLSRAGRNWGNADCSYFSYAQCRSAIIAPPGGDCLPNPWASHVSPPANAPRR
jgi:hypothetical protein